MTIIMVDIESDGPIPHDYSMISFGAVVVDQALDKTFYGQLKPISDKWIPEALAVSGFSREQTLDFDDPLLVMQQFSDWLKQVCTSKPMFFSDNNGFDWQFINWYFIHFLGHNPFGFSSTNLGSLYKGMQRDMFVNLFCLLTRSIMTTSQGILPPVAIINNHVVTTSKAIAEFFNKRHDNILRTIDSLKADCESGWYALNFEEIQNQIDLGRGRSRLDHY